MLHANICWYFAVDIWLPCICQHRRVAGPALGPSVAVYVLAGWGRSRRLSLGLRSPPADAAFILSSPVLSKGFLSTCMYCTCSSIAHSNTLINNTRSQINMCLVARRVADPVKTPDHPLHQCLSHMRVYALPWHLDRPFLRIARAMFLRGGQQLNASTEDLFMTSTCKPEPPQRGILGRD